MTGQKRKIEEPDGEESKGNRNEERGRSNDQNADLTKDFMLYEHHKRPAPRPTNVNKNNIYITRESVFVAVCARIRNVIANTKDPVILHAMGAAITRCCNIALAVQDDYMGRINISVNTDTVPVIDDFEPLSEDLAEVSRERNVSCIRITLHKTEDFV